MAVGLFLSIIPTVNAASTSQTIQVTIIIPERPAPPAQDGDHRTEGWRPPPGSIPTVLRDGDHPPLLYTFTDPN